MNSVLKIKSWKNLAGNCCIFESGDAPKHHKAWTPQLHSGFWLRQCLTVVSHTGHVSVSVLSLVLREHWHQPHVSYTPAKASWWHFQFLFTLSKSFLFDFLKVVDISLGKGTVQNQFSFHQDSNFLSKQLIDFFLKKLFLLHGLVEKYSGEEGMCYVNSYFEVC